MKKKIGLFSLVLSLCLLAASVSSPALEVYASYEDSEIVTLDIKIKKIPEELQDISAITIRYSFDSSKLKYKGTFYEDDIFSNMVSTQGNIVWYDATQDFSSSVTKERLKALGSTVFTVTFEKTGTAYKDGDISITFAELASSDFKVVEGEGYVNTSVSFGSLSDSSSPGKPSGNDFISDLDNTDKEDTEDTSEDSSNEKASLFADIPKDSWGYEYADFLKQKGIISGDAKAVPSMYPDDCLTRAQGAKIILLSMGIPVEEGGKADFKDADAIAQWALPYMISAFKNGILTGYADGSAGADDFITREQLVTMLVRALNVTTAGAETTFADAGEISPWAAESMAYAQKAGIITGYDDGTVRPKSSITRLEAFALIARCIKK